MLFGRALTCDKGALASPPLTLHFYPPFSPHHTPAPPKKTDPFFLKRSVFLLSLDMCIGGREGEREKNTFQMTFSLFPTNWILTLLAPSIYVTLSRWMQAVRPYLPSCLLGECLTLIIDCFFPPSLPPPLSPSPAPWSTHRRRGVSDRVARRLPDLRRAARFQQVLGESACRLGCHLLI